MRFTCCHNGDDGQISLGEAVLSDENIESHSVALADIGSALTDDGDLLIYGCDVAESDSGVDFIARIAQLTDADVAASDDKTGSTLKNGDWILEQTLGQIDGSPLSSLIVGNSFKGVLAIDSENFDDTSLKNETGVTTYTLSGWTLGADSAIDIANPTFAEQGQNLNNDGDATDRSIIYNYGGSLVQLEYYMKSADGTDFDLNSLDFGNGGTEAGTVVSISGYRDNSLVVSAESVDLATSDSAGSISYTKTATTAGGVYGVLTFGASFDNVDEIRFSFNAPASPEIDNISVSPVAVNTAPVFFGRSL